MLEIWGFHSGDSKDYCLSVFDAVYLAKDPAAIFVR